MSTCKQCGTPMTSDSPQGLCARCLLSAAMRTQANMETADAATLDGSADARPAIIAARQLGPIQLIWRIGVGGMGEVWLGRHDLWGVKFLKSGRAILDALSEGKLTPEQMAELVHPLMNAKKPQLRWR